MTNFILKTPKLGKIWILLICEVAWLSGNFILFVAPLNIVWFQRYFACSICRYNLTTKKKLGSFKRFRGSINTLIYICIWINISHSFYTKLLHKGGGRGGKRRGRQIMYIYVIIYIQYIHMYSTICMHIYLYMPVVICTCR